MPKRNPKHKKKHQKRKFREKEKLKLKTKKKIVESKPSIKPRNPNEISGIIISQFKKYNFEEIFLWLSITSIHPNNTKFQFRFEFLFVILLSIQESEFKNISLSRDDFNSIILKFVNNSNSMFRSVEDFIPFDQMKLIPIYFAKEKFFFFQGAEERTYEMWKTIERCYVTNENLNKKFRYKSFFLFSLRIQTKMLKLLQNLKESNKKANKIYIPSIEFYNSISSLFIINDENLLFSNFYYEFGEFAQNIEKSNFFSELKRGNYFSKLVINNPTNKKSKFLLLPQTHVEILMRDFYERTTKPQIIKDQIIQFHNHIFFILYKYTKNYFRAGALVNKITLDDSQTISIVGPDIFVLYDNYLLVFSCLSILPSKSLSISMEISYKRTSTILNSIKATKNVEFESENGKRSSIESNNLRFRTFFIFEYLDYSMHAIKKQFPINIENSLLLLKDLIMYFKFLLTPVDFIKFINDKYLFSRKSPTFDEINYLSIYISYDYTFPHTGATFDGIMIDQHDWCDFFNLKLFEQYKKSIYSRLDPQQIIYFNKIKQWKNDSRFYEAINTDTMIGADILLFHTRIIYVYYPKYFKLQKDFEYGRRVFAPMFADYILRMEDAFEKIFLENSYKGDLILKLYPIHSDFNPYREEFPNILDQISGTNPVYINVIQNENELILNIFYDWELWINKFPYCKENISQKNAMELVLHALLNYFKPQLNSIDIHKQIGNLILKFFPLGPNDYFFSSIDTFNPYIENYKSPVSIPNAYYEDVIEEAEIFLKNNSYKKGKLKLEDSKKFLNELFKLFYNKVIKDIQEYDYSLLILSVQQYELLLGSHKNKSYDLASKKLFLSNTDDFKTLEKNFQEITNLISVVRYLTEVILKTGLTGKKIINEEDWCKFVSQADYLLQLSQRSDWVHSGLIPFEIEITDLFNFKEIQQEGKFDYDQFREDELENKITALSQIFTDNSKEKPLQQESENHDAYFKLGSQLDEEFKKNFGFSFSNAYRFLLLCGRLDHTNSKYFPVELMSKRELVENIKNQYKKDYEKFLNGFKKFQQELELMIEYFSLTFQSYKEIPGVLLLSKLLRSKNRLSLCPIVKYDEEKYILSNEASIFALSIWEQNVLRGNFPYTLDSNHPCNLIVREIGRDLGSDFEKKCGKLAENILGKENVLINLKNFKRISEIFPKFPDCGEIDFLAINRSTKKIFVMDAKSYYQKLRPADIKNEINDMLERDSKKKKSNLFHLKKKKEFINQNIRVFLDFFKISEITNWKIKCGFILRNNLHSAYSLGEKIDMVIIDDLISYLNSNNSPKS